jgi:hypothetical protein
MTPKLKAGALALNAPMTPGGPPVIARPGDAVLHVSQAGWHICICTIGQTAIVPVGGLVFGASDDNFHWSTGPSSTASDVPQTAYSGSFDNPTSIGHDGRISGGADGKPSY